MKKQADKRNEIQKALLILAISIVAGVIIMSISCLECLTDFEAVIWSVLYSGGLGITLYFNRFVSNQLEKYFIDWNKRPKLGFVISFVGIFLYSVIAILIVNYVAFSSAGKITLYMILQEQLGLILIEILITFFIASLMHAISFFKEWRDTFENQEKLKHEALNLKYEALRTQVNPHFFFNSLNALSSLVDTDKQKAQEFIQKLSALFRKILDQNIEELITVEEELLVLKDYLYLQKIRFGDNLRYEISISDTKALVVPLSFQMLAENAIKHNIITKDSPLNIEFRQEGEKVLVINNLQPKNEVTGSNKLGLSNLKNQYGFFASEEFSYFSTEKQFIVSLPIIKN